jgi:hypothetical protein
MVGCSTIVLIGTTKLSQALSIVAIAPDGISNPGYLSAQTNPPASPQPSETDEAFSSIDVRTARPLDGQTPVQGFVGNNHPYDLYRLTLAKSSDLSLRLDRLQADADMLLFQDTGKGHISSEDLVTVSIEQGTTPDTINQQLSAGAYLILVQRTFNNETTYTLSSSMTPVQSPS